ncbi:MAG: LCP family protein [Culicoidibacterales bacterium]
MFKKIMIGLVAVIVCLVVAVGAVIGGVVWYAQSEMTYTTIDKNNLGISTENAMTQAGVINIALFGVDARTPGEPARSDSMMIATLNPKTKQMYLTSLMRDMLVPIDGYGMDKLNHAYAYGGAQEAMKTLNQAFGLNIEYYATVDFTSLTKIIDALGGVSLDVDSEELPHLTASGVYQTGVQLLNGEQALAYSRIRYASGGDYARTERQQEIITSVSQSLANKGLEGAIAAASQVLPYVETNIGLGKMIELGTSAFQIGLGNLSQLRFPQDGTFTSGIDPSTGMWVINADLNQVASELQSIFTQ